MCIGINSRFAEPYLSPRQINSSFCASRAFLSLVQLHTLCSFQTRLQRSRILSQHTPQHSKCVNIIAGQWICMVCIQICSIFHITHHIVVCVSKILRPAKWPSHCQNIAMNHILLYMYTPHPGFCPHQNQQFCLQLYPRKPDLGLPSSMQSGSEERTYLSAHISPTIWGCPDR